MAKSAAKIVGASLFLACSSSLLLWSWILVGGITSTSAAAAAADDEICISDTKTFTARVHLHAGELGYHVFEECGMEKLNPTITMEVGETYTFVQKDRTNYYHPLGFAYVPFGDEVEPGISKGRQDCIEDLSCSAPMYFLNEEYLGHYSNIPEVKNVTTGEEDFGLDVFEPLFFRSPHEWTSMGTFSVKFRFDDDTVKSDLFYFCHIHKFMGGRIKLTKNGQVLNELDTPDLGYTQDVPSAFDEKCGTFALGDFELPNPLCPAKFVCTEEDAPQELRDFSHCIDAMNCHMLSGMTTGIKAQSQAALFIHQMIPHHQNAVNMAKLLLKGNTLKCDDLSNDEDPDCILESMMYEIVNNQNLQIQQMYEYLDAKSLPEQDNCNVYVDTIPENIALQSATTTATTTSSGGGSDAGLTTYGMAAFVFGMIAPWLLGALY